MQSGEDLEIFLKEYVKQEVIKLEQMLYIQQNLRNWTINFWHFGPLMVNNLLIINFRPPFPLEKLLSTM